MRGRREVMVEGRREEVRVEGRRVEEEEGGGEGVEGGEGRGRR